MSNPDNSPSSSAIIAAGLFYGLFVFAIFHYLYGSLHWKFIYIFD